MKKRAPATPDEPPAGPLYPLEMVAQIAATLAIRYAPVPDNSHLKKPAEEAIALLQTCEKALSEFGKPTARERLRHLWSDVGVTYPAGSFKKELLRFTRRDTEADALPLFKKYLVHKDEWDEPFRRARVERNQEPATDQGTRIEERLKYYRTYGLGGVRVEQLEKAFSKWYDTIYLPGIKRVSGARGGRPKKNSATDQK